MMSDCVEANLNRKQRKENVEEVKEKSLSFWDLENHLEHKILDVKETLWNEKRRKEWDVGVFEN